MCRLFVQHLHITKQVDDLIFRGKRIKNIKRYLTVVIIQKLCKLLTSRCSCLFIALAMVNKLCTYVNELLLEQVHFLLPLCLGLVHCDVRHRHLHVKSVHCLFNTKN